MKKNNKIVDVLFRRGKEIQVVVEKLDVKKWSERSLGNRAMTTFVYNRAELNGRDSWKIR